MCRIFFAAFPSNTPFWSPAFCGILFSRNTTINILHSYNLFLVFDSLLPFCLPFLAVSGLLRDWSCQEPSMLTLGLGFFRHGKVYHPVFCVGVRKHGLRTPVTVLVSLDRIIPWQFAPQQCLPLFHPVLKSLQHPCLQGQASREWRPWRGTEGSSSSAHNLSGSNTYFPSSDDFDGLRLTNSIRSQLRVSLDHRSGRASLAASYTALRWSRIAWSSPL